MANVLVGSDEAFMDVFLSLLNDHDNTKMIATIDSHGQPLDLKKVNWSVTIAEEEGYDPIIATLSPETPHFIMFSKRTKLTGYLSFRPIPQ